MYIDTHTQIHLRSHACTRLSLLASCCSQETFVPKMYEAVNSRRYVNRDREEELLAEAPWDKHRHTGICSE